jgi:exodeoxyribonuclease III
MRTILYSGVSLHVSQTLCPDRPHFSHPAFDFENRIVTAEIGEVTIASIYVPNDGKDFPGKMRFVEALDGYAESLRAAGKTTCCAAT